MSQKQEVRLKDDGRGRLNVPRIVIRPVSPSRVRSWIAA